MENIKFIRLGLLFLSLAAAVNSGSAFAQAGPMMSGTTLDLSINPALPFDRTTSEKVTLSFTAKAKELEGASVTPGKIDHLDYKVIITKDGMEVWSEQFHDHDGDLELEITPSSGADVPIVTGGQGTEMTSPYMVKGPIFMQNGNYVISAQIVGIEFNPLPSPLKDEFSIQVVPEFPVTAIMPTIVALATVIGLVRLRPRFT